MRLRSSDAARLALACALLAAPGPVVQPAGPPDGAKVRRVARVLGARYAVQGLGGTLVPRPWVRTADVGVDVVHAASMLVLARVRPAHRRVALLSAGAALVFAALDHLEETP